MSIAEEIRSKWPMVALADLAAPNCKAIVSGPFGSNIGKRFFVEAGVPVIRGNNLTLGKKKFVDEGFVYITEAKAHELRNCQALAGDIVFTAAGTLGQVGVIPGKTRFPRYIISNKQLRIRIDQAKADSEFLYYWFSAPAMRAHIANQNTGSSVPLITLGTLRALPVVLPPIAQQRRIASILSAYDDLIENNTRRIAILEEMARRIYEEWFVRFRFPGHENVRMVESELGPVPEGWERRPLGSFVAHHIGGGWGQEDQSEEFSVPAYVIRGTDIPDVRVSTLGRAPLRHHTPSNFRSRKLQGRDIVFEVSGGSKDQPVGRAVMIGERLLSQLREPVICASFCRLVRADASQILPELLLFHFERIYANREIMQYQTQSTGITNFKFTVFLDKENVVKPATKVQEQFAATIRPLLDLVETLGIKNANLRTTRDLLLPKLISGELDVSAVLQPKAVAA